MQLYPPVHGASSVGENIKSSQLINDSFDCDFVRISTIPIGKGGLFQKIKAFVLLYINVFLLLLRNKYDLVYVAPCASRLPFYKDFGLCMLAKMFNNKMVYHFHNKGISTNHFVPAFVMRIFFKNVKVILSSPTLYFDVERFVAKNDVYYCVYGIKDDASSIKIDLDRQDQKVRILFFAHMMKEKGAFVLLEACRILHERNVDFICNFVGSWYDISELEFNSFVEKHHLNSKIFFLGPQYGMKKDEVLSTTDLFAFPTFYKDECFPLGLLEALRWSLPVITTNEGAITEIVKEGVNGYIIEQHNSLALADKLEILINNPTIREQFGVAGRSKFEKEFTLDVFEYKMNYLLNEVLKSSVN